MTARTQRGRLGLERPPSLAIPALKDSDLMLADGTPECRPQAALVLRVDDTVTNSPMSSLTLRDATVADEVQSPRQHPRQDNASALRSTAHRRGASPAAASVLAREAAPRRSRWVEVDPDELVDEPLLMTLELPGECDARPAREAAHWAALAEAGRRTSQWVATSPTPPAGQCPAWLRAVETVEELMGSACRRTSFGTVANEPERLRAPSAARVTDAVAPAPDSAMEEPDAGGGCVAGARAADGASFCEKRRLKRFSLDAP
ncbi:unnamed protein product [Pedinophyceae sp. YPF-701]|nr:unnamed protein product [Pedinophyceae sp. YPF-701]